MFFSFSRRFLICGLIPLEGRNFHSSQNLHEKILHFGANKNLPQAPGPFVGKLLPGSCPRSWRMPWQWSVRAGGATDLWWTPTKTTRKSERTAGTWEESWRGQYSEFLLDFFGVGAPLIFSGARIWKFTWGEFGEVGNSLQKNDKKGGKPCVKSNP